jgi:hypothetical protein
VHCWIKCSHCDIHKTQLRLTIFDFLYLIWRLNRVIYISVMWPPAFIFGWKKTVLFHTKYFNNFIFEKCIITLLGLSWDLFITFQWHSIEIEDLEANRLTNLNIESGPEDLRYRAIFLILFMYFIVGQFHFPL